MPIRYVDAAEAVVTQDGLRGLFGRGLKAMILASGLQGLMSRFSGNYFLTCKCSHVLDALRTSWLMALHYR